MKKSFTILLFALFFGFTANAQKSSTPFLLSSSTVKMLSERNLAEMERRQTRVKESENILTFVEKKVDLLITTGPEDDMLSYRIQGLRNPTIVVTKGATLRVLFVNTDEDMLHDVHFGANQTSFEIAPKTEESVGTPKLKHRELNNLTAQEIIIEADSQGEFVYFCSVRGHAKGGMFGKIVVGQTPKASEKPASTLMKMDSDMKMDGEPDKKLSQRESNETTAQMPEMSGMNRGEHGEMMMASVVNLNDPMTRESSGTAWNADSSPMYAKMKMFGDSMLMFHGTMFGRYTNIGSERDVSANNKAGKSRFDAPSMFMAMYSKPVSRKSQIGLRAMLSLDPLIERGYGYPLLYQSGETYKNQPLHDRQHPHDFISELSASYSYRIGEKQSFYFYAGLPGEPALGPPTFMHRISAMNNPDAPLSHHWQDSTHITFGVVTAGYSFGKVKFETSIFNGSEPNENRFNFDKPRLNSISARVSWNPTKEISTQFSHGYLKNPEYAEPEIKVRRRTTASIIYNKRIGENTDWANTFVWGQNDDEGTRTNAFLFESDFKFHKNAIFGRLERVEKTGQDLALNPVDQNSIFKVGSYSVGFVRDLFKEKGFDFGLGTQATFNQNPVSLNSYYGGANHQGFQIFFRIRPSAMKMH